MKNGFNVQFHLTLDTCQKAVPTSQSTTLVCRLQSFLIKPLTLHFHHNFCWRSSEIIWSIRWIQIIWFNEVQKKVFDYFRNYASHAETGEKSSTIQSLPNKRKTHKNFFVSLCQIINSSERTIKLSPKAFCYNYERFFLSVWLDKL